MTAIVDTTDPFPLHCELAAREFAKFRDAQALADPVQRKRQMRYHLEQALLQFTSAQEAIVETANRAMVADVMVSLQKERGR